MSDFPSQPPPVGDKGKTPHVMIVGAGLAGLLLAILLDRQGVPYEIFERSAKMKRLGAVMSLNANILPAFEQLGLMEELEKISYPCLKSNMYKGNLSKIATITISKQIEQYGYNFHLFARPNLCDILLSRVPPERIHMNKKVMSIAQGKEGVMIRCSDGTTYHGDLLVGADGAYSGVRQGLYKLLQANNSLPKSDTESLTKGFMCLVGTTDELDPEKYPVLKEKEATLNQVIGTGTQYTWSAVCVPGNKICWNVVAQFSSPEEAEDELLRNSEWGPESSDAMIKEVREFLSPIGGTMGDLIDQTPRDTISRVFLEDKIFETWHYGRTVLIGDACHKLLPSAGQGAVNAMQDAVILANCIYDMKSTALDDVAEALQDFKDQRFPHVLGQYNASKINAKVLYGQTFMDRIIRHLALNYLPTSIQSKAGMRDMAYRPQVSYLPQIPNRGSSFVHPQKPSRRYQEEQAKAEAANASVV
ncbi:MAG: hypothetical protein J3Q66DRAFT_335742 [Benniella sp.]|nr:MAG: hypothetical protein J3Q66DRAFT_335742 [Benniella sp.]